MGQNTRTWRITTTLEWAIVYEQGIVNIQWLKAWAYISENLIL
jgi:hypothetical protein